MAIDDRIENKQGKIKHERSVIHAADRSMKILENVHPPLEARDELKLLRDEIRGEIEADGKDIQRLRHEIAKLRRKRGESAVDSGAEAMIAAAKFIGTTESPAGSNLGPLPITESQLFTGYKVPPGVYWCGCFACYVVVKIGGAAVPLKIRMGFGPSIIDDAHAGANGFHAVPFAQAKAGDVLVYWGGEHIGLVEKLLSASAVQTIEGNTSAADGSQSNGGGIYRKQRGIGDVTVVARPTYATV